jgi:hypothetical protein
MRVHCRKVPEFVRKIETRSWYLRKPSKEVKLASKSMQKSVGDENSSRTSNMKLFEERIWLSKKFKGMDGYQTHLFRQTRNSSVNKRKKESFSEYY